MKIYHFDVVCIGSGVAGMMASITAAEKGQKVGVVSKDPIGWGNTRISGGIVTTNEKNDDKLYEDILRTGENINQTGLVKTLINNSQTINDSLEEWGHIYLRNQRNPSEKELVKPGGHTTARTLKSHNRGISIANSLRTKFLEKDITTLEEIVVCEIIVRKGRACGILCYDWVNNQWIGVNAPHIILACGGGGMIYYPHSDNMRSSTGDGYALGLRAGARLIDMEQIQFIPFGILYPRGMRGLEIGDTSAAGPYGVLRNADREAVVTDLPNKTREHVARAIAVEVRKGKGSPNGGLWLDPTENRKHSDGEKNWEHWKSIGTLNTIKMAYGTKAAQWSEPFEVSPTQHYFIGGLYIDKHGRTDILGLYAVGESAGGFHGAGRMGSMSLFEALTFGKLVGEEVAMSTLPSPTLDELDFTEEKYSFIKWFQSDSGQEDSKPIQLKRKLSKVMWEKAGVVKDERSLRECLMSLEEIEKRVKNISLSFEQTYNHQFLEAIELQSLIITAKAVVLSAIERRESRGSHYRSDYPEKNEKWQERNVFVTYLQNKISIRSDRLNGEDKCIRTKRSWI